MIYLLEDDDSIRELVVYTLNNSGFEAKGFALPSQFREAVKKDVPELALLDVMLPEEDGLSVLRSLRGDSRTKKLPVIMLTAKSNEYDKVLGLDCGADDYVPKPFGMMELIARIKALLRRSRPEEPEAEMSVGGLVLNPEKHTVAVNGEQVALTLKEFETLRLLMENRGKVMTRDVLLDTVWGYDFDGESRTVDVHIRSLRQKLGNCGALIETVRGIGYKISD